MSTDGCGDGPRPPKAAKTVDVGLAGDYFTPPRRQVALSLLCVGFAMFLAALAQTVVASIVPLVVADLGGFNLYTWPSTSYLVAATVAYPIVGRLSDIYGRRAFLIAGIAVFVVGSALVGLSGSMNQVIGFRAVQGFGGGIIMTCCYVSVADLFPPEDRGKFHGVLGAIYALATVVGPVMGVLAAEWLSWHFTFLFIALAGVPVLVLTARYFPGPHSLPRRRELDYPGMVALALAVTAVALALSSAEVVHAWNAPQGIVLLAFGLVMAVVFVTIESRSGSPIMPLGIYRNQAVAVAVIVTLLTSVALHGFVLFLPLYFQVELGMSATQAGTMLVPMLLGIVLGAILAGQLLSRAGGHYRIQAVVSAALMAGGMYLFSTQGAGGGIAQSKPILFSQMYLIVAALGFGGVVATLSVAVQNGVAFENVGTATASLQFSRSLGGMMGLAATGAVMLQSFRSGTDTIVPDNVRGALPEGLLDSVKEDPRVLVDPARADVLKERIAETGSENLSVADSLMDSLNLALTGALSDVFTVLWVAVALSFLVAMFLHVRPVKLKRPEAGDLRCGEDQGADTERGDHRGPGAAGGRGDRRHGRGAVRQAGGRRGRAIQHVRKRLEKLYEAIETSKLTLEVLSPRIMSLRHREEQLEAARDDAETQLEQRREYLPNTEEIARYVADFREFLKDGTIPETKVRIRNFVEDVEVEGDEATLTNTVPMPSDGVMSESASVLEFVKSSPPCTW